MTLLRIGAFADLLPLRSWRGIIGEPAQRRSLRVPTVIHSPSSASLTVTACAASVVTDVWRDYRTKCGTEQCSFAMGMGNHDRMPRISAGKGHRARSVPIG